MVKKKNSKSIAKKQLTRTEEFELMKLVMDKFLLLGVFMMGVGFYMLVATSYALETGFAVLGSGAIVMLLFSYIMVKEYQFLSH